MLPKRRLYARVVMAFIAIIVSSHYVFARTHRPCKSFSKMTSGKADYYINGLFPYYNDSVKVSRNGLLYMEIVRFTLDEANENSKYKIGYQFYDTCGESQLNISAMICMDVLLSPPWMDKENDQCICTENSTLDYNLGLVGPASSSVSKQTMSLLANEMLSVISYASTSPNLNDRNKYPYFLRTIPNDLYQAKIMVDLLKHFNWNYVSLVASDNFYGRTGSDALMQLFKENKICIRKSFLFSVPYKKDQLQNITNTLRHDEKSNIIILWALGSPTREILKTAERLKLYNKTWIFTEALGTSSILKYRHPDVIAGSFTILPNSGYYPKFHEYFFNISFPKNWTKERDNSWVRRYFQENKKEFSSATFQNFKFNLDKVGYVRNSVKAYIEALKSYVKDRQSNGSDVLPPIKDRHLFYTKYLSKVKFKGLYNEDVYFDETGNVGNGFFDILNIKINNKTGKILFNKVASYDSFTGGLRMENNTVIYWSRGKSKPDSTCSKPCPPGKYAVPSEISCCWTCYECEREFIKRFTGLEPCEKCPSHTHSNKNRTACLLLKRKSTPYGTSINYLIYFLVFIGDFLILMVLMFFVYFRDAQIVRASNFKWSVIQLISHFFIVQCGLVLTFTVSMPTCLADTYTSSFLMSFILSIILVKADLLSNIFKLFKRLSKREMRKQLLRQFQIITSIVSVYVFIHVFIYDVYHVTLKEVKDFNTNTISKLCINSAQSVASSLYILAISIACSLQLFRNRNLPSLFNEGKLIMYAVFVLTISIVLILMVQIVVAEDNRPLFTFVCVYISNLWILASMFYRKIYQIICGTYGQKPPKFIESHSRKNRMQSPSSSNQLSLQRYM